LSAKTGVVNQSVKQLFRWPSSGTTELLLGPPETVS